MLPGANGPLPDLPYHPRAHSIPGRVLCDGMDRETARQMFVNEHDCNEDFDAWWEGGYDAVFLRHTSIASGDNE